MKAALIAYHSLLHARMTYGVRFWGESTHATKIFILQKAALRAIEATNSTTHCKPLFRKHNILTLTSEYLYAQLIKAYRDLPKLQRRHQVMNLTLRNANQLTIPYHRTSTTAAQHRHLSLMNALPNDWLQKPEKQFRRDLKALLLEGSFYNVAEFTDHLKTLWSTCRLCGGALFIDTSQYCVLVFTLWCYFCYMYKYECLCILWNKDVIIITILFFFFYFIIIILSLTKLILMCSVFLSESVL